MMKSIYEKRSKSGWRRPGRLALLAIALVIVVLVLWRLARSGATQGVAVALKVGEASKREAGTFFSYFQNKARLSQENTKLKQELVAAQAKLLLLDKLKEEKAALQNALGKKASGTRNFLLATVLHDPRQSPYDTLLIDLGADNTTKGVRAGQLATIEGEWLIGEVVAVYGRTAKVALFSQAGRETGVTIGSSGIPALAHGRGGGNFLVELPWGAAIETGAVVETVRRGELWPIGLVAQVKSEPGDAFQTAIFKNPVNIYEIKRLEIISD